MAKVDALNFVPCFIYHFTGQQHQKVMDMTVKSMNDPDAGVRLTASITVGGLGDTSAIAALQAAAAREQDPNIRSAMLRELNRLQGLQPREPHRE